MGFSAGGGGFVVVMVSLGLSGSQSKRSHSYHVGFGDTDVSLLYDPLGAFGPGCCGCGLCRGSQRTIDCEEAVLDLGRRRYYCELQSITIGNAVFTAAREHEQGTHEALTIWP